MNGCRNKYAKELEQNNKQEKAKASKPSHTPVKTNKKMVLHHILEEDSDEEKGSDEDVNKTFDLGKNYTSFGTKVEDNLNKSTEEEKSPPYTSSKKPHDKISKHSKYNSFDLSQLNTKKLKEFIHSQSKFEKEQKVRESEKEISPVDVDIDNLQIDVQLDNYNTPRFDEDDQHHLKDKANELEKENHNISEEKELNKEMTDLQVLERKIQHLKKESNMGNTTLGLNESGMLEYSMEMHNKFKGLLNGNDDSTILNESLNTSKIGRHRRQYSNDGSVLFGREYMDETFNQIEDQNNDDSMSDINTSNFLNLKGLLGDTNIEEQENFDFKNQEEEFKRLFEEEQQRQGIEESKSSPAPAFGLRNDSQSLSDNSQERPQTPDNDTDVFNPFKSPVVPVALDSPVKSESAEKREHRSTEKNKKNLEKASDPLLEWNKRITKALNEENYYNDAATKLRRKTPMNPLEKLTLEQMKDEAGATPKENRRSGKNIQSNTSPGKVNIVVAGSENKKLTTPEPKQLFASFNNDSAFVPKAKTDDVKMIKEILKIEIILIIINTDIVSDFEVNRSKKYLKDFLAQNPEYDEAHYGLSQVYFSLGLYNKALEEINISLENNKTDSQYLTWKALYLYYLFKNLNDKSKKIEALRKCEETCKKILVNDRRNIFPLFLTLTLMLEVKRYRSQGLKISSSSSKRPEDYAIRIKEINSYLGELCFAEIQLFDPDKVTKGRESLLLIVEKFPTYPHAFLRLCIHDYVSGHYSHALDTIEQMYSNYQDFETIPELETGITLLYAKTLFKEKHYVASFEVLQEAFCKRPNFTVFLYELGKYEIMSDMKNFRGSAIGILQECLRSCVSYRKAEINYYLGIAFKKSQQPLKAFEYFQTSFELYKDKNYHPYGCPNDKKKVIKSFIEEYYDINKFEYIITRKAKAAQEAAKENKRKLFYLITL